jgi:O-antigen ligase
MADRGRFGIGRRLQPTHAAGRTAGSTPVSLPQLPPWVIVGGAALISVVCGRLFADGRIKYGAALVLAAVYAPLVFFDLAWAFALWVGVLFVQDLHALSIAPNTMGVLVALGWIGAFVARAGRLRALHQHRKLLIGTVLFVVWLTVSIAWAQKPGRGGTEAAYWWLAALTLMITITTLTSRREIGIVAVAFVLGAVAAAVVGLVGGGLYSAGNAIGQTAKEGRLTGGGGDPNVQAAAFIAAMFLTMGLFSVYRHVLARLTLLISFVLVTVGFFATQSRGGLLALAFAAIAALVLARGQRRRIVSLIVLAVLIAVVAVAIKPGALGRITNFGGGTSGRNDIWRVATKIFEQHPIVGIGLNNFAVSEPRYALKLGNVTRVTYIAELPDPTHNSYLQVLVEDGIIGLAAFLFVIVACLRAAWLAAQEFDRTGRREYGDLARATLMGTIGMLSAIFFITDGNDWRLWVLLGLGPALLALARHGPLRTAETR